MPDFIDHHNLRQKQAEEREQSGGYQNILCEGLKALKQSRIQLGTWNLDIIQTELGTIKMQLMQAGIRQKRQDEEDQDYLGELLPHLPRGH